MKTVAALHLTFITTLNVHTTEKNNLFTTANKQQKHFKWDNGKEFK
jgi:hypothetical protein